MKSKKKDKKEKKRNKKRENGKNGVHVGGNGNMDVNTETMEKVDERLEEFSRLSKKELIKRAEKFSEKFRVTDGKEFRLKDFDPDDDGGLGPEDKDFAKKTLAMGVKALAAMQDVLYAQDKWAVLLIFQAMDGAGIYGALTH